MLGQLNLDGMDKVETAIKRLRTFEPPEGYHLAYSGGKDSVVIMKLAEMAEVNFTPVYRHTSVDPPELVHFVRSDGRVVIDYPRREDGSQITMWNLIPTKRMPPTRVVRYCCEALKESAGEGEFVVTGVRKQESAKRSRRGGFGSRKEKVTQKHDFRPRQSRSGNDTHL